LDGDLGGTRAYTRVCRLVDRTYMAPSRVAYAKSFCTINTLIAERDYRKYSEMTHAVIVNGKG